MHARALRSTQGFTLVEALIASIILGLCLGSVLTVASRSFIYLSDIRRTARSSQVLQQKMEDLRLLSWSLLNAQPATFTDPTDPCFAGTVATSPYDTLGGTTTVMTVTLTVTWTNQSGKVLTNQLSTLMTDGGLNTYIF